MCMIFSELVRNTRSFRRFNENDPVPSEMVKELIDLARICPSAANRQPLRYRILNSPEDRQKLFPSLHWAAYLKEWPGPAEGERPSAYILVMLDTKITKEAGIDIGIAAQTILAGAVEQGYGGCMFGAIKRDAIRQDFSIPDHLEIPLVIALGKPAEKILLEETGDDGSIKYYRDSSDVHHVPKRPLSEVLLD